MMYLYKSRKSSVKLYNSAEAAVEQRVLGLPGALFVGDTTEKNGRLKVTFEGEDAPQWWVVKEYLLELGPLQESLELAELDESQFINSSFIAARIISGFRDAGGMNAEYLLLLAWSESKWTNSDEDDRVGNSANLMGKFGPFRLTETTWQAYLQDDNYQPVLKGYNSGDRLVPESQSIFAACLANQLQISLTAVLGSEPAAWLLFVGHKIGENAALLFAQLAQQDVVSTEVEGQMAITLVEIDSYRSLFPNGAATTKEQVLAAVKVEFINAAKAITEKLGSLVNETTLDELAEGFSVSRSGDALTNKRIKPYADLLSFIAKGEGGYNSMNNGTRGDKIVDSTHDSRIKISKLLTDMTLLEIIAMQEGTISSGRKLFAVGRYQIIPETLKFAIKHSQFSFNTLFTEKIQDALAVTLIQKKRPALGAYLKGESNDLDKAMHAAAREWASLPNPKTGKSAYGSGNRALHSRTEVSKALISARNKILNM
jgi:hypothetical protein